MKIALGILVNFKHKYRIYHNKKLRFIIFLLFTITGTTSCYQAGNLNGLSFPIDTSIRSSVLMQYMDTLVLEKGYSVPNKWKDINKLVDIDSVRNKRIYFNDNPEEMYLISFGGMPVLMDVYNPSIREDSYISERKYLTNEEELRIRNRLSTLITQIENMAKGNEVPDSLLYKHVKSF